MSKYNENECSRFILKLLPKNLDSKCESHMILVIRVNHMVRGSHLTPDSGGSRESRDSLET